MKYNQTIQWLFGLQKFGIKLGLDNITAVLRQMGDPQKQLRSVVVGGTNGKGSTAKYLTGIAEASGLRCGLYTSPHLQRFNERIVVAGKKITDDEVVALTLRIKSEIEAINKNRDEEDQIAITFFEFTTIMAACYFLDAGCDLAVFEVGMGGRLDATNVMPSLASVVTTIGLEHMGFLGDTLEKIAYEKAGIIHEGTSAVTGERKPEALSVFQKAAKERSAELYEIDNHFKVQPGSQGGWDFSGLSLDLKHATLGIPGNHQADNAACALAAWEIISPMLSIELEEDAVRSGLENAMLPARLQQVCQDPPVLLDVSHNPDAAGPLVAYVKEQFIGKGLKPVVLMGMMGDKDAKGYMKFLSEVADDFILTRSIAPDATDPGELLTIAGTLNKNGKTFMMVPEAMKELEARLQEPSRIGLIVGSFYVVGEAMDYMDAHPKWPGNGS